MRPTIISSARCEVPDNSRLHWTAARSGRRRRVTAKQVNDAAQDALASGVLEVLFKNAPNLKAALRAEVDPDEFKLQLASQPFPVRGYKRIAVKVVNVYGNESTVVRNLASGR
ncbi:MAG: hypothetical protein GEU73_16880 [Chloroflexi bacterium]|nr:hypothetical protein [Chloroflexota bacterium]